MIQWKPGNQRRGLKLQKPSNETSLFQTTCRRGKDDAGVGIQRLKGTCSIPVLSSVQLQDVWGSFEAGEAWGNAQSYTILLYHKAFITTAEKAKRHRR